MLTGEHAAEFQIHQFLLQRLGLGFGLVEGLFIFTFDGQRNQHLHILGPLGQDIDGGDNRFQGGAFLPQGLSPFRLVPDIRLFQLGAYFFQTLFLGVVVKGTPSEARSVQTAP